MQPASSHEARFADWMEAHAGIVAKVARAHAQAEREREDLARELTYQIWLSVPRFAGHASPATWIYRVCLNTAMTWRRDAGRRSRRHDPDSDLSVLPSTAPGPATAAERTDLLECVFTALRALPEFDRSLLLLQLDGLAYREIAEVTGLTENHIGVALNRARQRLTAHLKGIVNEMA